MPENVAPEDDAFQRMEARYLRSEAMTAAILNSMSAHIAVLDEQGIIIAVNEGWKRFATAQASDSGPQTYLGKNYLTVLERAQGDDAIEAPLALDGILRVLKGEVPSYTLEYPCFTPDEQLWFLMQVTPLEHPDGGVVIAHIDITARKHEELRKDLFISVASHELKTPLTSMKLLAQLALRRGTKAGYSDLVPQLETLSKQTETLSRLVNDLLDVSRLHTDQIELHRTVFDLGAAITAAVEQCAANAPDYHYVIAGVEQCQVRGDQERIQQVLTQLLANAAAFSPIASTLTISLICGPREAVVRVRDEGIGIDPSHHEHIFDPFYQVAEFSEKKPGMGMGLYLAQQIMKRHGGKLWVESARGEGATFAFTLPLAQ